MTKYRTLEEVVVDGVGVGAGQDIELTEEQATALEGKVEVVAETPATPAEAPEGDAKPEGDAAPEEGAN